MRQEGGVHPLDIRYERFVNTEGAGFTVEIPAFLIYANTWWGIIDRFGKLYADSFTSTECKRNATKW